MDVADYNEKQQGSKDRVVYWRRIQYVYYVSGIIHYFSIFSD